LDGSWRAPSTVGGDSSLDRKEREMNKFFSIALGVVLVALAIVSPAAADSPSTPQGSGGQIAAQERGRNSDPRLFNPSGQAPVQVVGDPDRFDLRDAVVGGAAVGAVALLAAAGLSFGFARTRRTASPAS
jgi:hypothetical protein